MIRASLRQLCLLSVFCGAALSLSPEGNVKKLMNVLVTAVLLISALGPVKDFDFSSYVLETARLKELEEEFSQSCSQIQNGLNELSIEKEYEAYIRDKAAEEGLSISSFKINLIPGEDGLWVPDSVEICSEPEAQLKEKLSHIISTELGIGPEKQHWSYNG